MNKEILIFSNDRPGLLTLRTCKVLKVTVSEDIFQEAIDGEMIPLWSSPGVETEESFLDIMIYDQELFVSKMSQRDCDKLLRRFGKSQRTQTFDELVAVAWEISLQNAIRLFHPDVEIEENGEERNDED